MCCGAIGVLGFAPYAQWYAPLISLSALFYLLQRKLSPLYAWCWGVGLYGFGISWIYISIAEHTLTPPILAFTFTSLLVMGMGLFPAVFVYLLRINQHRWRLSPLLSYPALWVLLEWSKEWFLSGFPWLNFGGSQLDGPLSGLIPIGGTALASLVVAQIAILCSQALSTSIKRSQRIGYGVAISVLVIGSVLLDRIQWVKPLSQSQSLVIVQGNVPQDERWLITERERTLYRYVDMTAGHWGNDVIIWPEAAIPAVPEEVPAYLDYINSQASDAEAAFITGIPTMTDHYTFYNSVITLGNAKGQYNKHHLVPFGEYVPFEEGLRQFNSIFNLPMSSFHRGPIKQVPLEVKGFRYAVALCYEIAFPAQVWRNHQRADAILTLSNDAWFGDSKGPHQHMEMARLRAKELGRPVIRSTNNGITAIALPDGTLSHQLPQFEQQVLEAKLYKYQGTTPFWLWGPYPVYAWSWLIGGIAVAGAIRHRHTQKAGIKTQEALESAPSNTD